MRPVIAVSTFFGATLAGAGVLSNQQYKAMKSTFAA